MARAADTPAPVIAPVPAWVKPVATPSEGKADDAAVHLLLSDQQVLLEPGRQTVYTDVVMRLQTPQGLAAGNVSLPWRPDTDVLTVHTLLIRRGDQVIDVLKSGQTFTVVRRETNLESAMLDGVLTANIQPEGLQVGDLLELGFSVTSSDPTLKGHAEQLAGAWNILPIGRAHLRMTWPTGVAMRLRATEALPALKPVKAGATTSVDLLLEAIQPVVLPKGAPARYGIGRLVEATDFAGWDQLSALMAPLYAKAATLPADGPLLAEVARIKALSLDPKRRAEAALALVQDRVRYVALAMGAGGLVPTDAATTWARRYGDCKGKTALLIAVLHALDIAAEPVLVSTVFGDGLDARLPMIGLFNHVLVRATIAGKAYWMDGTRTGDTALDRLTVPAFGWGLPVVPSGAALVRMVPPPLAQPSEGRTIRIDASAGLTVPAPIHVDVVFRGDAALATRLTLANLAGDARDRALRDYWKGMFDFVDAKTVAASFDPATGEEHVTLDGTARMDWKWNRYETDGTTIGYKADFSRPAGPQRDAPFAVAFPYYTQVSETILLPKDVGTFTISPGAEVDRTIAGIAYRRHTTIAGNVFTIDFSERSVAPEFASGDAVAAQAALRTLADQTVYVFKPANYRGSERETAAALETEPTTARGFVDRGNLLMDRARFAQAVADFDKAAALDPRDAWSVADRGLARFWTHDLVGAARDFDAAAQLDPRNPVVFRGRGLIAQEKDDPVSAIAAYSRALELAPDNLFTLDRLARMLVDHGENERALSHIAAAIKLSPRTTELYLLQANVLRRLGRTSDAAGVAVAVAAANPDDDYAHVVAANIFAALDKDADAMREYARALAIKPAAYIYINRAQRRPAADLAGRRADVDAALELAPADSDALAAKAEMQEVAGDWAGAVTSYSIALLSTPGDPELLVKRGVAYLRNGRAPLADKDFTAARAKATTPAALNGLCWAKAEAGVALDLALSECDAALAKSPDAGPIHDSRGLVLLRLGRYDEAIAAYDRALAKAPGMAASLYGRGVAWSRKGDKTRSAADVSAALKAYPDVRADFDRYGVKP